MGPGASAPTPLKAASVSAVLFAAFYGAFVLAAPALHGATPPTDPALVNRWYREWIAESDGIELQAMLVAVTACLGLAWLLASRLERLPWFRGRFAQVLCAVPAALIVARVRTSNFTPLRGAGANLAVLGAALGVAGAATAACRLSAARPWLGRSLLAVAGAAVTALVVLGAEPGDTFDYGFFLGPALKLAAGERLGSFYIQYNLVGTWLFRALVALRLAAAQIQAVLGLVLVAWLFLYWLLARRLLASRALALLFVQALVTVRFLAIAGGPATYPQVSPLRMDLWVPLALVVSRFGTLSPWTAAAFALVYLADNVFGLLFGAAYGVAAAVVIARGGARGRLPARLLATYGPLLAVAAFQVATFGSLANPAASTYQALHLGFLPIGSRSMFWLVLLALLFAMFPIVRDAEPSRRSASLWLYAFAAVQLVYFYGRSHDHNLLNLAGIWLLITFVGVDRLREHGWSARACAALGVLLAGAAALAAAGSAMPKLEVLAARVARGVVLDPFARDVEIAGAPRLFDAYPSKERVFLFSENDAYYAYRYGLPQLGYFSPLQARVLAEPTAAEIRGRILEGYTVVLYGSAAEDVTDLDATRTMFEARQRFVVVPGPGPLLEVRLAPR